MTARPDHRAPGHLEIRPVTGLPEFTTDSDVAGEILGAAPWLESGDVLVVTSKIISKAEGRMVDAPSDPEERDALRRRLVDAESVRVLARKNRTLITENRLGLVQAAAGIDGSNVRSDQLALLPENPDRSAASLRRAIADAAGLDVAVIITDTMGRAWRTGQTDVAIGAAGIAVTHPYEGGVDDYGNPLIVTEIAVADELAAAVERIVDTALAADTSVAVSSDALDGDLNEPDVLRRANGESVFVRHDVALHTSTEILAAEDLLDSQVLAAQLTGQGLPAALDLLVAALCGEPVADLGLGARGHREAQPVVAGACVLGLGGEHLHHLAVLERALERDVVHPGDHQHRPGAAFLRHRGEQAVGVAFEACGEIGIECHQRPSGSVREGTRRVIGR